MAIKLILDTDIGTDIDDAICLTYLLANKNCNLLGITTCTGEPEKRAMIASSLCKLAGRDVPIYPGEAHPLRIKQRQIKAVQSKSLNKWEHDSSFPKNQAIEFLKKTIEENEGEVTLLTIGPLTNIGKLFSLYPETAAKLKSLVLMGGYYQFKFPGKYPLEWNIRGDYHASEIVFNSNVPEIKAIGLDVTSRVQLASDEFKEKFNAKIFEPLQDYAQHWYSYHSFCVTFHDPLAGAVVFNDNICKFEKGKVRIRTKGNMKKGLTEFKKVPDGNHYIAIQVNKEEFFREYFSVFK